MKPISISINTLIVKTFKDKSLVSSTFIATFKDGTQKMLNNKAIFNTAILKPCEQNIEYFADKNCTLYYKDWSNVPTFGTFKKHYPR